MPTTSKASSGGWYKATVYRRFFALFIDGIIIGLASFVLIYFTPKDSPMASLVQMSQIFIGWIYAVLFVWQSGATPGKMAMKIRVVGTNGQKLSLWQAILREVIGKFISGITLSLGYLWALWDPNRQTWHDKIAGTYVVTKIPNDGKGSGCLVALAIALFAGIPIIAIVSAVVVLMINPLELTRVSRDTARISEATQIQKSLIDTLIQNPETTLCADDAATCLHNSREGSTQIDGSGWIPVAFTTHIFTNNALPVDPINDEAYFYNYCVDGESWELNFKLESERMKIKMTEDQGDNNDLFELGSALTVCK